MLLHLVTCIQQRMPLKEESNALFPGTWKSASAFCGDWKAKRNLGVEGNLTVG